MSDTPRTDAECMSGGTRYTDMVHYTFAQQLERELEEDNSKIEKLKMSMLEAHEEILKFWDAHRDTEGYGPANLMHLLESCMPETYPKYKSR